MRVGCPQCGTQYELPATQLRPGLKVKCRRCSLVFAPTPAAPGAPEAPKPAAAGVPKPAAPSARPAPATGLSDLDDLPEDPYAGLGAATGASPSPRAPAPASPAPQRSAAPSSPAPDAGGLGGQLFGDLGAASTEAGDDPFAGIDVDVSVETARPGGVRAEGMSTIRAQQNPASAAPSTPAAEGPAGTGWLLRTGEGAVLRLDDLERVRAWIGAHPDTPVELSSDGNHWRAPEAILGIAAEPRPASVPRGTPLGGTPLGGTPVTSGPSSALRAGASAPRDPNRAGPVWALVMLVSTAVAVAAGGVAAQALHLVDVSGTVPLGRLGLARLVPVEPPPPTVAAAEAPTPAKAYASALRDARAARQAGHLVDAVVAYRRALAARTSSEALEGLADTYALLGDAPRAEAARRRLSTLDGHAGKKAGGP